MTIEKKRPVLPMKPGAVDSNDVQSLNSTRSAEETYEREALRLELIEWRHR